MYTSKDIAIVILNWNGRKLLEQFLPSVVKFSNGAHIYLADNASNDDSVEFLKESFRNISIIQNEDNFGYAKGYNLALQNVIEPIFCLLNNDVEVTKDWLQPILDTFNKSEVAILQPKLLDYKKKSFFEYAGAGGGLIDKFGYPYCRGRVFNSIEEDKGQYNDTSEILWASGACLFIKNDVFKHLGGFDSTYFAHMEEIDLCWRAFNENFKIVYVGESIAYHVGGATLEDTNPRKTYLNFRNSLYTLFKNTNRNLWFRLFIRMSLDGIAAIRFLLQLKPIHALAIIRAHGSFYGNIKKLLIKRRLLKKRAGYYKINSIVWAYFIKGKTNF